MGITITAKNSTYSFDMGCGGFFNLRKNIALALDKDFGDNYARLLYCHTEEDYEENNRCAEKIIVENKLEEYGDILDFLYASDADDGKISYKTCGRIYELIKDVNIENKIFRYAMLAHNDYGEFKIFLKECYSKRRNMYWY